MIDRPLPELAKSFVALAILVLAGTVVITSWKSGYLPPLAASCLILLFALLKSRCVIKDFLGLRERRSLLRRALLAWPAIFAGAALLRTVFQGFFPL